MIIPLTPLDFRRRALKLYPEKTAVVCGDKKFTYREFGIRTNKLANGLLDMGVKRGDRVAFISYNCHRLLEAYYGVLQAGAVLLPINIRFSPREIAYILNDSEATALFFNPDFIDLIKPIMINLKTVKNFVMLCDENESYDFDADNYEKMLARSSPNDPPELEIDENEMAELFYTSGTTGANPKGVMLTHRSLYLHGLGVIITHNLNDSDAMLHTIPLFHVNGWGTPQALTCMGGTHVMLKKFDPETICRLIEQEKITKIFLVHTMANMLMKYPGLNNHDFSSLKRIVLGGAPAPWQMIKEIEQRLKCECIAGYGLTETSPYLTSGALKSYLMNEPEEARWIRQARTGLEVVGVDLRVVNEQGEDVQRNDREVGEIIVRSNYVMQGYWKLPQETAKVIRDGWFYTGDMATVDKEGYVKIVDRKKDIIISGGENIASIEIERVLYEHPAIYECAVIGVPDEKWGEVPKAIVVLKEGYTAEEEELLKHCRERLAKFKVPKSIEFTDSLPKGGTGKILKRVIREKYWQGYEKRVY
ncbi:fatty acid--CoA ligase [Desulfofundulus salinus]|uniref:Fatty acid--CoA ligase n=1 Tax=Desulfofundulus salinus TaxID=2419843 RepID=A0A494X160_9FIRM|nr:fatty acid--CoA ligase [Desulfofundulus salinum]RKO66660.1 fatty acid--CoA ligase [Desulfofundulus salinum]